MEIAVLGLGEAGRVYAEGLRNRGATVRGFDPAYTGDSFADATTVVSSLEDAVRGADITLSVAGASAAASIASSALSALAPGSVFADMNTAAPELKQRIAAEAHAAGVLFADVAIMAPVPRAGVETPLIASGTAAEQLTEALQRFGIPIESIGAEAGAAAGLKLLRSVFMKGLAALVIESLTAAEQTGSTAWLKAQIAAEFGPSGEALVDRLLTGTAAHAGRRAQEMRDAREYLASLGTPSHMTEATLEWLESMTDSRSAIPDR